MSGIFRFSLLLSLIFAAAATALSAGNGRVFHERADVSLVEVPVSVAGRDGQPVSDLTAADFRVEDEGHPETITAVDAVVVRRGRSAPDLPDPIPEAARRHFLFLFDLSFATPAELIHSRDAAVQFIEGEMSADDRAAVATTSVETGPRLRVNFTSDRRQLVAAIRSLGGSSSGDVAKDSLGLAFVVPGSPSEQVFAAGSEATEATVAIGTTKLFENQARRDIDRRTVARISRHLAGMQSLAAALDVVEGTKRIIYFSAGFDARLIFGNLMQSDPGAIAKNDEMANGFWTIDVDERYINSPLSRQINETMELFRRSDCVIYAVDVGGLRAGGEAVVGRATEGHESLYLLAHETGGEVIQHGEDLAGALHRVGDRLSLTYVLSFRPTVRLGEGKFHRLKVKAERKGSRVSARAGYYETRAFRTLNPLERSLMAADVINGGRTRGDIPIGALAIPFAESGIARVPVLIQAAGASLADPKHPREVRLGLYVYVTDQDGALADYFSRTVSIDLARQGGRLSSGFFRYQGACRLLPGRYVLRVLVRDEESGRYGFTVVPVEVPEYREIKLRAFPPLFVGEGEAGVNLRDSASAAEQTFEVGGAPFVPQLDPSIPANGGSKICLIVYRQGGDAAQPFTLDAEILDSGGRPRGAARVALIGRTLPDSAGLTKLLLDFSAADLPPGSYSLRVTIRDPRDRELKSASEAPFAVS